MFVAQRALSEHKGHKELLTYYQPFVFVVFSVVYFVLPKLLLLRQPLLVFYLTCCYLVKTKISTRFLINKIELMG